MQFITFAAMGAVGTAAHYVVLIILVSEFKADAVHASIAGFVVGAAVNYWLNYHVTFGSVLPHRATAWKFFSTAAAGLVLNAVLMSWTVRILELHYLAGQVIATLTVLVWNYVVNRYWTFRRGRI